jgi:hypothetical protein
MMDQVGAQRAVGAAGGRILRHTQESTLLGMSWAI